MVKPKKYRRLIFATPIFLLTIVNLVYFIFWSSTEYVSTWRYLLVLGILVFVSQIFTRMTLPLINLYAGDDPRDRRRLKGDWYTLFILISLLSLPLINEWKITKQSYHCRARVSSINDDPHDSIKFENIKIRFSNGYHGTEWVRIPLLRSRGELQIGDYVPIQLSRGLLHLDYIDFPEYGKDLSMLPICNQFEVDKKLENLGAN